MLLNLAKLEPWSICGKLTAVNPTLDLGSSPQYVIASAITRMHLARPIRLEVNLGNYDDGPSLLAGLSDPVYA